MWLVRVVVGAVGRVQWDHVQWGRVQWDQMQWDHVQWDRVQQWVVRWDQVLRGRVQCGAVSVVGLGGVWWGVVG